jgi:hypothetical protein
VKRGAEAREAALRAERNWPDDGQHPVAMTFFRWLPPADR